MTASKFIKEQHDGTKWEKIMREFAKYHVELALKQAKESVENGMIGYHIINCYPLTNIK